MKAKLSDGIFSRRVKYNVLHCSCSVKKEVGPCAWTAIGEKLTPSQCQTYSIGMARIFDATVCGRSPRYQMTKRNSLGFDIA